MYYWNEKYENILDYAPKPRRGGTSGDKSVLKCVCKDESLQEQLDKLLDAFCRITSETVSGVAVRYLKEDLCCCNKNYCKHTDVSASEPELDSDVWDLYTYFLNEFNTKDIEPTPKTKGPQELEVPTKQETVNGDSESEDEGLFEDLFGDDSSPQVYSAPQDDPYFKVKIMDTMKECMKYRDIHRFYLLQHIKLLLHFFNFAKDADKEYTDMVLPPGD